MHAIEMLSPCLALFYNLEILEIFKHTQDPPSHFLAHKLNTQTQHTNPYKLINQPSENGGKTHPHKCDV